MMTKLVDFSDNKLGKSQKNNPTRNSMFLVGFQILIILSSNLDYKSYPILFIHNILQEFPQFRQVLNSNTLENN